MPLKSGSPIRPSLGNTSSNFFIRLLSLGGRTLGSESVVMHVSAPLQRRRREGCLDKKKKN